MPTFYENRINLIGLLLMLAIIFQAFALIYIDWQSNGSIFFIRRLIVCLGTFMLVAVFVIYIICRKPGKYKDNAQLMKINLHLLQFTTLCSIMISLDYSIFLHGWLIATSSLSVFGLLMHIVVICRFLGTEQNVNQSVQPDPEVAYKSKEQEVNRENTFANITDD